jgi:hypothetical protein
MCRSYIVLNERINVNDELQRIWKKEVMAMVSTGGTKENMKIISKDSESAGHE